MFFSSQTTGLLILALLATGCVAQTESRPETHRVAVRISINQRQILDSSGSLAKKDEIAGVLRAVNDAVRGEIERLYDEFQGAIPTMVSIEVERSLPLSWLNALIAGVTDRAFDVAISEGFLCSDPRLMLTVEGVLDRCPIRCIHASAFPGRVGYREIEVDELVRVGKRNDRGGFWADGSATDAWLKSIVERRGKRVAVVEVAGEWPLGFCGSPPRPPIGPVAVTLEGGVGQALIAGAALKRLQAGPTEILMLVRNPVKLVGEVTRVCGSDVVVHQPQSPLGRQRLAVIATYPESTAWNDSIRFNYLDVVAGQNYVGRIEIVRLTEEGDLLCRVIDCGPSGAPPLRVGQIAVTEQASDY